MEFLMKKTKRKPAPNKIFNRPLVESNLYQLCLQKMPKDMKNIGHFEDSIPTLNVPKIAKFLNLQRQTVYVWFHKEVIPPAFVAKFLSIPGSKLTLEDIRPFAPLLPSELVVSQLK